jgi:L-threonylcarbamoyladenylate synthase
MIKEEVEKAAAILKSGGVILYPTDTIWGLGCDATNAAAVEKIFAIKNRSNKMSLIALVEDDARLNRHVQEVPAIAWDLIDFATEPLTIIYPKGVGFAPFVCAEDGSVAIRKTNDDFCKQLIRKLNRPLVSTSANISGKPAPDSFMNIDPAILASVDYTVNLRQSEQQLSAPSKIIQIGLNGEIKLIR